MNLSIFFGKNFIEVKIGFPLCNLRLFTAKFWIQQQILKLLSFSSHFSFLVNFGNKLSISIVLDVCRQKRFCAWYKNKESD